MRVKSNAALKAHKAHMELEKIIEDMVDAMRSASMKSIALSEKMTVGQSMIWSRYVDYAMKVTGTTWINCPACNRCRLVCPE